MPAFPLWNAVFLFFRGCGDDFGYLIKFSDLYTIETIADIIGARSFIQGDDTQILYLQTDSRRINFPAESLFFAIRASRDGHDFIFEAWERGVKNFVVSNGDIPLEKFPDANFLLVPDTLVRSEEHTSELQSLMRISYAVFCLTKKKINT